MFRMNLQKQVIITIVILSVLAPTLIISEAMASPRFIETPTIEKNSNSSLTADFNATGLPNLVTTTYLSSAGGDSGLKCVDLQQQGPPSKLFSFNALKGQEVAIQPVNGEISNSSTIGPPQLPSASDFCFISALNIEIESITYEKVVLHLQQNGQNVLTFDFGDVGP
jgi:hypothetical protein